MTRFYLGTTSYAGPAPAAFTFAWDDTAGAATREMTASKVGASTTVAVAETNVSAAWDVLLGRFISPPMLQDGTIPEQTAPVRVAWSQSDPAADLRPLWGWQVIDSTGAIRHAGPALVYSTGGTTTATERTVDLDIPAGGLACQVGDRFVVELGYRAANAVTTSYTGTLYYAGTGDDLQEGDTGTDATTRVPYLSLDTANLFDPLPTVPILRSAGAAAPVLLGVDVAWGADITDPVSWVWTDVTADVQVADGNKIFMVHGKGDESSQTQPASCSLLLDNSDGRYSLGPESSNYPYVRRNTPVRARVQPGADPRAIDLFVGFADGWTPRWDLSGANATVALSASGTLRRLLQRSAPIMSSLRRAMVAQIEQAGSSVVAYWPLEDGPGASLLANLVPGGRLAAVSGTPDLASNTAFLGSAPIVSMNKAIIRGTVPTAGNLTSAAQVRWLMDAGGNPSADVVVMRVSTVGTITRWDVSWQTTGAMRVQAWNNSGAQVVDSNAAFNTGDTTRRWQLELSTTGGTVSWRLNTLEVGFTTGGFNNGTVGGTVTAISSVVVGPDSDLEAGIGHVTVYRTLVNLYTQSAELNAYRGETAEARLERLCAENNVPVRIVGSSTVTMGPQSQTTLVELLREVETADQGLLLDGTHAGLTYICGAERVNADAALTLDASSGGMTGAVEPHDDDQRNVNRVTASRTEGAGVAFEDTDGPFGTVAIGEYEDSVRVNISNDSDVLDYAGWAVHLGTRPGYRYPSTQLALHHNPELTTAWADTLLSDRIDLTNISAERSQFPDGAVSALLEGCSQSIDQFSWDVSMVLSAYDPWRVGTVGGPGHSADPEVLRLISDGSTVATLAAQGATSLSVATPSGPLWSTAVDDVPFSLNLGDREVVVSAVSGATSPQTFTVSALPAAVPAGTPIKLWRPAVLGVGGDGTLIVGSLVGARSLRRQFPQVDYAPELSAFQTDGWSDVAGLSVQVESQSRYALEGYIAYDSSTAADIQFAIMAPRGASGSWGFMPLWITAGGGGTGDVFAARTLGINNAGDADAFREVAAGTGGSTMCSVQGYMVTGPQDGVLQLRFAQNVITASATQVRAGSWLRVTRLGGVVV